MSRGVLQERCSANMNQKIQENNLAEARIQHSHFATLLISHPRLDVPLRFSTTSAESLSPEEQFWRTDSVCQKSFRGPKL